MLDVAAEAPSLAACKKVDRSGNSVIYAADGSKLGLIDSDEARAPVAIERIPKQLQLATVAIEDQRFYEHGGVDPEGIARAALKNLEAGKTVEGGSTITQQLVRNLCIRNPKRNLERKIIEAQLAIEYAERHSRQEILDQYLNTASYGTVEGATAVGVQAPPRRSTSPSRSGSCGSNRRRCWRACRRRPRNTTRSFTRARRWQRRNAVLAKMAHLGYISPARGRRSGATRPRPRCLRRLLRAPRALLLRLRRKRADRTLRRRHRAQRRAAGLHDARATLQEVGLEAMRSALPYSTDPSSALVSIDPGNGEIEAMVSSSSYDSSQFNLAAQGHRQPGSTFKAFVLTTAIKQGIDPYSTYYISKPLDLNLPKWGHWEVHTADEGYLGRVNLQQATVASDNTVFAQLDLDVGPQRVAATAKSMGITSPLDGIPAEGIGGLRVGVSPLEMADAYATLASGGIHHDPVAIRRVEFPGGRVERPDREPTAAGDLRSGRLRGDPAAARQHHRRHRHRRLHRLPGQAGKTGTTDRETDAWFAGYQPNLTTVVWVGYPQSNAIEMTSVHGITVFGGTFPAEIWHSLYSGAEVPCEEFSKPKTPISWAPYFGHFTAPRPRRHGGASSAAGEADEARKRGDSVKKQPAATTPTPTRPGPGQEPAPRAPATARRPASVAAAQRAKPGANS